MAKGTYQLIQINCTILKVIQVDQIRVVMKDYQLILNTSNNHRYFTAISVIGHFKDSGPVMAYEILF